jgi:hypothetical protein
VSNSRNLQKRGQNAASTAKQKLPPRIAARNLLQRSRDASGGGLRNMYLEQAQHEIAKLDPARYSRIISQLQSEVLALQGRHGDTEVAHLTQGEFVVPKSLQSADVVAALQRAAAKHGVPLEVQAREASPPEIQAIINEYSPDLGPRQGSVGRANVTNIAVDEAARKIGLAAKGLEGVNAVMAAHDIATSDNPVRATVANAGAIGGGLLGGFGGAALGATTGPCGICCFAR